jgi:hypothetical protein
MEATKKNQKNDSRESGLELSLEEQKSLGGGRIFKWVLIDGEWYYIEVDEPE